MTTNVFSQIAEVDPAREPEATPDWDILAPVLLSLIDERDMPMETQTPQKAEQDQTKRRRGWLVAAAAFAVVIGVIGLSMLLSQPAEAPPAVPPPTTQALPPTTEALATEASTTTQVTTTTTQPATTATTLPSIENGIYTVPDDVAPETYRLYNSAVRLDENMDVIDSYLVADPGFGIVIVQPTDSFISVNGWIITVDDFGRPIDPIAEGLINGVYLVGYDVEPGRYQVASSGFLAPSWARLDDEMGIIDSATSDGTLEVIVEATDFALEFNGILRLIP